MRGCGSGSPCTGAAAHTAADEVQLVARASEHPAEFAQHVAAAVERHLRGGQQLGISSRIGHVWTA